MVSIERPPAKGNLGPIALRTPTPAAARKPEVPWVVRTPQTFLDARNTPYRPRVRLMMLILDGHCRGLPYTWYSNAALAEEFGCELRNLKEILREMEGLGLIHRVIDGRGRTARVGIVMRKRADPDLPAAETEQELADAIARLEARRGRTGERAPTVQKTAPAKGRKTAPELRSYSREDASSEEAGEESVRPSRRRPQTLEPPPTALAGPPRPGPGPEPEPRPLATPPDAVAGPAEEPEPILPPPAAPSAAARVDADRPGVPGLIRFPGSLCPQLDMVSVANGLEPLRVPAHQA